MFIAPPFFFTKKYRCLYSFLNSFINSNWRNWLRAWPPPSCPSNPGVKTLTNSVQYFQVVLYVRCSSRQNVQIALNTSFCSNNDRQVVHTHDNSNHLPVITIDNSNIEDFENSSTFLAVKHKQKYTFIYKSLLE